MEKITLLASEKQYEAIECFFGEEKEDILYGGAARWGKSETIGMILAIVIAAMPWSSWLIARTILSDLKATTLTTFYSVLERFGYGPKSYRDKIRDERHIVFDNRSKLYVLQVNYEPGDPEYDRIWSFGYTWAFLDEGQQMSNKVREVLQGRLSELDGSFVTEVPMEYADIPDKDLNPWFEVEFKIVWETVKNREDRTIEDYVEEVVDGSRICYITRIETLRIPYKIMKTEIKWDKLFHTYAWSFKWCILTGCNPWTNFTRSEFYKPWKSGELPPYMEFIPAKVWDNPWVDRKYVERLERLPDKSIRKQRLLYGNFDYDDNPAILYDQDTIEKMYSRKYVGSDIEHYITIDAARQWKDKTEIWIWKWLDLFKIYTIDKWKLTDQSEEIRRIAMKYDVDITEYMIVDEVWVGWGLVDLLWCKWFIWNGQPIQPISARILLYKKRNYKNLRSQAFYYLQKYMSHISVNLPPEQQQEITEELLTVKEKNIDMDGKLQIIPKKEMKQELWRSPDKADMMSMRMWWLIKNYAENGETVEDEVQMTEQERDMVELWKWLEDDWDEPESKWVDTEIYD